MKYNVWCCYKMKVKMRTRDSHLYVHRQQIRPTNLSVLLLIIIALVTGGLL